MGEVVFVDSQTTGDMDKVPEQVRSALGRESGSLPIVALSNADGSKVYGTASHDALLGGLDKALRDAKRAMRDDQKGNPSTTAATKPKASSDAAEESASVKPADIKITEKNGAKDITGAPLEQWTSSKGSSVVARVTKVAGAKVTLLTDKGKSVTLGQADLAPASFERLQEILTSK